MKPEINALKNCENMHVQKQNKKKKKKKKKKTGEYYWDCS